MFWGWEPADAPSGSRPDYVIQTECRVTGSCPDCRPSGPLPFRPARIAASVGRARMWIRRSLRACRSCRAGGQTRRESVAVRMKADAPGQDGVRRRIQRGESLLDAGFDIDRDQPLNGVLRRQVPVKIERNERQRCLIKNAGSWGLWSRAEPEKRRNHSGATTGPRLFCRIIEHVRRCSR
jgi:hypothetical protein